MGALERGGTGRRVALAAAPDRAPAGHRVSPASVAATKRQLYDDLLRHDVGAAVEESKVRLDQMMGTGGLPRGRGRLRERRPPRF